VVVPPSVREQHATQRLQSRSRLVQHLESKHCLARIELESLLLLSLRPKDLESDLERPSVCQALGQLLNIARTHAHTSDLHTVDSRQVGQGSFRGRSATDRAESRHSSVERVIPIPNLTLLGSVSESTIEGVPPGLLTLRE
jgi:hypothetical protein